MIKDYIYQYYVTEGNHCSDAIYRAALVSRGINVAAEDTRFLAGFTGGMSVGDACGALTGGIVAIGYLVNKNGGDDFYKAKRATKDYYRALKEKLGTINCIECMKKYRQKDVRCLSVVEAAAEVLEEVLNKYEIHPDNLA